MRTELADIAGVRETAVTDEFLANLPANAAPAPWRARARGMFWWRRPDRKARAALAATLPNELVNDTTPLLTIAAMLSYDETPVGAYHEVLAIVALRRTLTAIAHVPFIAVDSPASVVGGRANWALPKVLASFVGEPRNRETMRATGPGWEIRAVPQARGPALPWAMPALMRIVQIGPGHTEWVARLSGRGTARLAQVHVAVAAEPTLADWFPTGRCAGCISANLHGHLPASRT